MMFILKVQMGLVTDWRDACIFLLSIVRSLEGVVVKRHNVVGRRRDVVINIADVALVGPVVEKTIEKVEDFRETLKGISRNYFVKIYDFIFAKFK